MSCNKLNRRAGFYYRSAPIVTLAKLIEHFYHRALTESEGGNGASTYLLHYKEGEKYDSRAALEQICREKRHQT